MADPKTYPVGSVVSVKRTTTADVTYPDGTTTKVTAVGGEVQLVLHAVGTFAVGNVTFEAV